MEDHRREYDYGGLKGADTIRVLRLLLKKGRLERTLKQIEISDGGYQALSYAWVSQEARRTMMVCNEDRKSLGVISLTENLRDALCDLRDLNRVESKVFWIDQISINQHGDEKMIKWHSWARYNTIRLQGLSFTPERYSK